MRCGSAKRSPCHSSDSKIQTNQRPNYQTQMPTDTYANFQTLNRLIFLSRHDHKVVSLSCEVKYQIPISHRSEKRGEGEKRFRRRKKNVINVRKTYTIHIIRIRSIVSSVVMAVLCRLIYILFVSISHADARAKLFRNEEKMKLETWICQQVAKEVLRPVTFQCFT